MNPKSYVGCCGAYCKTCKSYLNESCKGCKIGYENGERDINRTKCKIKRCCFKERKLVTCAECNELMTCQIINEWFSRNGYKYSKYKEAIQYINNRGYDRFFEIADSWHNAYGKYK